MKDFNKIYEEVLENSKDELEKLRKNTFCRAILCIIIMMILYFIGYKSKNEYALSLALILGIVMVSVIILTSPEQKYRQVYKEKVIKKFIKSYNENLEFNYMIGIMRAVYDEAEFEKYNTYSSEDLIRGVINNHKISMSEVRTANRYESKDGTSEKVIFHGLFAVSEFNNAFNGSIRISSDNGLVDQIFKDKNRIEMDSSEFEKYFEVIADDKIQAMQVLTSDIMNMMIEFREKNKIKFDIVIKSNKIYIRFKTGSVFEGNILKSSVNFNTLKKVFDIINFTFDITRALIKAVEETEI